MSFPKNSEILSILHEHVIGQDKAKERLVVALYNHFYEVVQAGKSTSKPNVLIIGPTGSGKTFLTEVLADALDVAIVQVNSAQLVPAGYEGNHLQDLFPKLLEQSGGNLERAEHAIVVLDEIDKRKARNAHRDDLGQMVQQELLKPLASDNISGIDTTNILFVGAGAFVGLTDIVRKRLNNASLSENAALDLVAPSDFEEFGLVPELIGRFPIRLHVEKLSLEDFRTLIRSQKDSFLKKKQRIFQEHGFELLITEPAMDAMADRAHSQGLGFRALQSVIADACDGVQAHFEDLFKKGKRRVEITEGVIFGTEKPRLSPSVKFSPDKSNEVRGKLDGLFDRIKPSAEEPSAKSEGGLTGLAASASTSNPIKGSGGAVTGVGASKTPTGQAPFSLFPSSSPKSFFTEAERRDLLEIIAERRGDSQSKLKLLRSIAQGVVWAGQKSVFWTNHPVGGRIRRFVVALLIGLLSYSLAVVAGNANELRGTSQFFQLLTCRQEIGIWHFLGIAVGVPVYSFVRYRNEGRILAGAVLGYAAIAAYGAIIAFGERAELLSFRHAIFSWLLFLDHALWRPGQVNTWNYFAAAVGALIGFWPLKPVGDDSEAWLPRVFRQVTGRGPSESSE